MVHPENDSQPPPVAFPPGTLDDALAALKARAAPAELRGTMAKLAMATRGKPGDDIDRRAQGALYLEYFGDYPADVVAEAAEEWIKSSPWFPAIADLRAICDRIQGERTRIYSRMREAQRRADEAAKASAPPPTPAERDRVAALVREATARLGTHAAPSRPRLVPRHVEMSEDEREKLLRRIGS